MKLDLRKYRARYEEITHIAERLGFAEFSKAASQAAVDTGVPIVVVYAYLEEYFGPHPALAEAREKLMKFYQVTELVGGSEDET